MAQLSMNETTTYRWSFEEDVLNYAAAGIPAIGVWRQKLSDCGEAKGIELLVESGLQVSHLFWAGGFTGSDGRSFRASVEDATEALRTAHALGTDALVIYSGARAGHTFNHARRLIREALKELAPLAAELEVNLAIEPMHPGCAGEFTFITSVDEALEVLEAVGSERVKIVFDTYHLGQDPAIIDRIPEIAPHVAIVQLGDARQPPAGEQNRCRLGEGNIPIKAILDLLIDAGYRGFVDVELLGEQVETIDYQELLRHAKDAYQQLLGSGR
jgi:sugar phosphate isomerase/epimerase